MSATLTAENLETALRPAFQGNIAPTVSRYKLWTHDECELMENAFLLRGRYQLLEGEIVRQDGSRKQWTRDECDMLEMMGLLRGRYELIEGEIFVKMRQNRPHALAASLLFAYLIGIYEARRVQMQATMEVRDGDTVLNRPEPDALVLREAFARIPRGEDALLAVEISDTTQGTDFGPKTRLYARAGVEEYWILDLRRRILVALRNPENDEWGERQEYEESESIAPLSSPESLVRITDLLP